MSEAERTLHDDHDAIVKVLREIVREENGLKHWAMGVAGVVAAAAIIGAFAVWRTQAVIDTRLTAVETSVSEIKVDVRAIRDEVISNRR